MAHECPVCYVNCHCNGDISDNCMPDTKAESNCTCCHDEDVDLDTYPGGPPCSECGAKTKKEAETMCICSGDKDSCHGCDLWLDVDLVERFSKETRQLTLF